MRQDIGRCLSLSRAPELERNMEMNTYDSHVQEFGVCYMIADWVSLTGSDRFDSDETQIHSGSVNTNESSTCTSSHRKDCCTWSHDVWVDRCCTGWGYMFCILLRTPNQAFRERKRSEQLGWKTTYSMDLVLFEFTGHIRLLFVIKWTHKIHHVAQTYFKDQWTVLIGPRREQEETISICRQTSSASVVWYLISSRYSFVELRVFSLYLKEKQ